MRQVTISVRVARFTRRLCLCVSVSPEDSVALLFLGTGGDNEALGFCKKLPDTKDACCKEE